MILTLLRVLWPRRSFPELDAQRSLPVRIAGLETRHDLLGFGAKSTEGDSKPQVFELDIESVYAAHGDFVWLCLQRFGVRPGDLPDMQQEVFIVVYKKLHVYDERVPIRSWLFGICRGKAASYRRKAWFRKEALDDAVQDWRDEREESDPEMALDLRKRRRVVHMLLDKLDVDKRVVFVMFEIEGLSCDVIAATIGVPIGTVYSRLHAARKEFEKAARKVADRLGGGL